jgi:hypothetical protein
MAITTDRKDLELSLLRTFLAVVRHGSMGRTAAAVSKTQPAVSQQMLRLEKIIGRRLFSRSRGGVKLTGHGELLVTYAIRLGASPPGPQRGNRACRVDTSSEALPEEPS